MFLSSYSNKRPTWFQQIPKEIHSKVLIFYQKKISLDNFHSKFLNEIQLNFFSLFSAYLLICYKEFSKAQKLLLNKKLITFLCLYFKIILSLLISWETFKIGALSRKNIFHAWIWHPQSRNLIKCKKAFSSSQTELFKIIIKKVKVDSGLPNLSLHLAWVQTPSIISNLWPGVATPTKISG